MDQQDQFVFAAAHPAIFIFDGFVASELLGRWKVSPFTNGGVIGEALPTALRGPFGCGPVSAAAPERA